VLTRTTRPNWCQAAARLLIVAAATFAAPALAQVLDPDATVSSDGSIPPSTREAAGNLSPSFEGIAGALAPMSAATMARYGARPASASDLALFRTARPRGGGVPIPGESVIGADGRKPVTNTEGFPARATAMVVFRDHAGTTFFCSGWLIGKDTVVTAGHCVADGDGGALFPVRSYRIVPGFNADARPSQPYGVCGARRLYPNVTWKNSGRDDYDYGAIKLDCTVGAATGWYGYRRAVATHDVITVEGYPGDKTLGTQWKMAGHVTLVQGRRVFYKADTFGGQSGSPVWRRIGTRCRACGIAIHGYGVYGRPPYSNNNHGARITTPVFQNLTNWKNAQ
jgi:glutamyl endopeptidase